MRGATVHMVVVDPPPPSPVGRQKAYTVVDGGCGEMKFAYTGNFGEFGETKLVYTEVYGARRRSTPAVDLILKRSTPSIRWTRNGLHLRWMVDIGESEMVYTVMVGGPEKVYTVIDGRWTQKSLHHKDKMSPTPFAHSVATICNSS